MGIGLPPRSQLLVAGGAGELTPKDGRPNRHGIAGDPLNYSTRGGMIRRFIGIVLFSLAIFIAIVAILYVMLFVL
jgi:hypothetical protein